MRLNPFKRKKKRSRRAEYAPEPWLRAETKRAIIGVLLILFAAVSLLSFVNMAGSAGAVVIRALRSAVGWFGYLSPFALLAGGIWLIKMREDPPPRVQLIGIALALVGIVGTLHTIGVSPDEALQVAAEGRGGGYLGFLVAFPLSVIGLSSLVLALIFIAAAVIGLIMASNATPAEITAWLRGLMPARDRSEESQEDEEIDAEEEPIEEDGEDEEEARPRFRMTRLKKSSAPDPAQLKLEAEQQQRAEAEEEAKKQIKAANRRYTPPPLELLASNNRQAEGGNVEENKKIIKATLENFNIAVDVGKAKVGPTVTQYTLRPDEGIRLSQITALQNDLARALKAHPVRIEAPIPNTDLVGIEIPNKEVALVRLRDLMESKEMKRADSPLAMALGKDVAGTAMVAELDRMPHLLIAGATNSGKSVSIHSIITSLIYRNSPQLLRLILIDPKRVELAAYNGLPHLWGEPVIVDTNKALNALKWSLREMDRRYKLLEEAGSRNILSYNLSNPKQPLPFIVIVIDELADLMAKHAREVEGPVVRLSQLARAVGVHLILATQRPSVNVITGLIKANIPARVAFKVASQVDSRTILDSSGAEKLVGTGDMLFLASDNTKPRRLQGGFVAEDEVRSVVEYIVEHNPAEEFIADEEEDEPESITSVSLGGGGGEEGDDPLFAEAKRTAVEAGKVSASYLQRRLRVGYARAARLLDMLEEAGIIGPAEGNKPREVLLEEGSEPLEEQDEGEDDMEVEEEDDDLDTPPAEGESEQEQW